MPHSKVVMLGAFPPPIGGAAKNNEILFQTLANAGVAVSRIVVSAQTLSHHRTVAFHAERFRRNLLGLWRVLASGGPDVSFYMVPDAGLGSWYSLAHLWVASRGYGRLILHHRTFRYIDQMNPVLARMTQLAPQKTTHIFLSPGMADRYQQRYGAVQSMVVSNARFVELGPSGEDLNLRDGGLRLGYLSNLCRDKGFFHVADLYDRLRDEGYEAELWLAGPILEPEVATRLDDLKFRHRHLVHYVGPVYGIAKQAFYRDIDLFLFPTQFDQEASPNVLYEAFSAGRPVLSIARGCIPEMVTGPRGAAFDVHDDFVVCGLAFLRNLRTDLRSRQRQALHILESMRAECALAVKQYNSLLDLLATSR